MNDFVSSQLVGEKLEIKRDGYVDMYLDGKKLGGEWVYVNFAANMDMAIALVEAMEGAGFLFSLHNSRKYDEKNEIKEKYYYCEFFKDGAMTNAMDEHAPTAILTAAAKALGIEVTK
jgi:hypothetical protein